MLKIGILALQGDVREHQGCLSKAADTSGMKIEIIPVREAGALAGLDGIILPGGESTTIWKLLARHGMVEGLKQVPCVFGTCAGLILMSKHVEGKIVGQETLGLLDCSVSRNAYGSQIDSFEAEIEIDSGAGMKGVQPLKNGIHGRSNVAFIRAPIIKDAGSAKPIAWHDGQIVGIESDSPSSYYLGLAFHPEITGETYFHRRFLEKCAEKADYG